MRAGVGSGGGFRKVPEGSGVCWCAFRRQVPEGSGEFRHKMVSVPEASSGRFRKVPVYAGVGSERCWKVPEGSGVCRREVPEGSGEFRYRMVSVPEASSGRFQTISV